MIGPPTLRCLDQPIVVSLEDLVPADHFYRHLEAKLDLGFVWTWVQDCYAAGGRPSIDPVVFFKLRLVMCFEGIRSERHLMRIAADRLGIRWYLGYDIAEPLPDHSSLTRIRAGLGLPIFQRFFARVVEMWQQAGLVWGKELSAKERLAEDREHTTCNEHTISGGECSPPLMSQQSIVLAGVTPW